MKRSTPVFFLILAALNVFVAVIPPYVGGAAVASIVSETGIKLGGHHFQARRAEDRIVRDAPLANVEAFAALALNTLCCLLILSGAVGLFMARGWGRWLSVIGGFLLILGLLVHDGYQVFIYRPALMSYIDQLEEEGRLGPPEETDGIKADASISLLMWTCMNPLIMVYLFVMSLSMALMKGSTEMPATDTRDRARRIKDGDDGDGAGGRQNAGQSEDDRAGPKSTGIEER
jgi:hypothetical protein